MEHDKHTTLIDDGGNDDGRGRDQWTQKLVMTSDVDWINRRHLPTSVPFSIISRGVSQFANSILPDLVKGLSSSWLVRYAFTLAAQ